MRYGIRHVTKGLHKAWRLFLPGMPYPTYHACYEEAAWAMRLRGYDAS